MRGRRAIRQLLWSHRSPFLGFALFAASLGVAGTSRADLSLSPSLDGHLGAFLCAAPVPAHQNLDVAALKPSEGDRVARGLGGLSWTVADGGPSSFDLEKVFGKTAHRGLLAGELVLRSALDGWLLVSADGAVTVSIDGKPVFARATAHLRGASWDPIAVRLAAGAHTLVLDFVKQSRPWTAEVRLLDAGKLEPPASIVLRLPSQKDDDTARLASKLADVQVTTGVVPGGFQPRVRVEFPRGAPLDAGDAVSVAATLHGAATGRPIALGVLAADPTAVPGRTAFLPGIAATDQAASGAPDRIVVRIGGAEHALDVHFDVAVAKTIGRALALHDRLRDGAPARIEDRETCIATLEARATEVAAFADRRDPSAAARAARLLSFVERLESGEDPLHDRGVLELARRSRVDGAPDPVRLHVPASYDPSAPRKYPLVVLLHGYLSTPERIMNAFLGTESLAPHPKVDGFVLAPSAHGDAFYRGPGETEIIDALDWALRNYPIDPERVSIAGHSMGGTGASQLAFRYPDRFSGVAALAGYHSFFVRRDIQGRPLRPWELTELVRWSPASFAENGRDEFLVVAQGTRDLPLAHSESLRDRYRELGYPFRESWPDIGHDVWRIVWGNADLWPFLSSRHLVPMPAHVTLKADSLRYGSRAWVRITELGATPSLVDATRTKDRVLVRTRGTDGLELRVHAAGAPENTTIDLDGQHFDAAPNDPSAFHRAAGKWAPGPPPPPEGLEKRLPVEGPIRDAWNGPLAFVYGTLDDRQTNAAREVAEYFRARWAGDTRYPLLADRAAPRGLSATHSLFLVGSKDTNSWVHELDGKLPFGIDGKAIRAGRSRIEGDGEAGFVSIYPNPANPDRYVVLLSAVTAAGLYRSLSLPLQLPDFIVFDSGLAPAAGQQVLGDARVLAGGYFDRHWALPASFGDVLAKGFPTAPLGAPTAAPSERRSSDAAVRAPPASGGGNAPEQAPPR